MQIKKLSIAASLVFLMTGCASSLSGLDASSSYACKAPDGVTCSSLSGVYANAVANNLPSSAKKTAKVDDVPVPKRSITGETPTAGTPIRSAPKMLRVWLAPWEDIEGDLHDQSYVYVMVHAGQWAVEHHQRQISDRYQPTFLTTKPVNQAGQNQGSSPPQPEPSGAALNLPGNQMFGQQSPLPGSAD